MKVKTAQKEIHKKKSLKKNQQYPTKYQKLNA